MEKVSYAGALKNKYVWIFGLGAGCFSLATVGIMSPVSQLLYGLGGYELTGALSMLTIAGCYQYDRFHGHRVLLTETWYTESL